MAALTVDEFALARHSDNIAAAATTAAAAASGGGDSGGTGNGSDTAGANAAAELDSLVSGGCTTSSATAVRGGGAKVGGQGLHRQRTVCNLWQIKSLEQAINQVESENRSLENEKQLKKLQLELDGGKNNNKHGGEEQLSSAERGRLKQEMKALKKQVKATNADRNLNWKLHKKLALQRSKLNAAKVEMEQLAEEIVDYEIALDDLACDNVATYASRRTVHGLLTACATVASVCVLISGCFGTQSDRSRDGSPVLFFVELDGEAPALWRLIASAAVLGYMCIATYHTLFSMRLRLMAIYPLRFQHNSVPVSVQTLATYMLACLNPICLWFTRIVIDPGSAALLGDEPHGSNAGAAVTVHEMAYARIYSAVRHVPVLTSDLFWGICALCLGGFALFAAVREFKKAMAWRVRVALAGGDAG